VALRSRFLPCSEDRWASPLRVTGAFDRCDCSCEDIGGDPVRPFLSDDRRARHEHDDHPEICPPDAGENTVLIIAYFRARKSRFNRVDRSDLSGMRHALEAV
jgi:hypothetical protein